jgi:hypothetical protein
VKILYEIFRKGLKEYKDGMVEKEEKEVIGKLGLLYILVNFSEKNKKCMFYIQNIKLLRVSTPQCRLT